MVTVKMETCHMGRILHQQQQACVADVTRSLVNVAKRSDEKIFLSMHKIYSSVQRLCNVWAETLRNICKTLYKRYNIVQLVTLTFRVRLMIVRKRWHSFVLYIAVDAQLFSLGRKETLSTGLVTISSSLRVPQAVILRKPLNHFILNAQVRYFAILARLLGCNWRTRSIELEASSHLQENRIDLEVLLYHRYKEEEQLQKEVVLFFWILASSLCRDLCQSCSSTHKSTDDDVCQRFYTIYGMTSWQRH